MIELSKHTSIVIENTAMLRAVSLSKAMKFHRLICLTRYLLHTEIQNLGNFFVLVDVHTQVEIEILTQCHQIFDPRNLCSFI